MKIKTFFLFIFLICLYSISYVWAINKPFLNKIIYIDPGHGGIDPGAMYKNIKEKDINLEISLKLKDELEKEGATVYLTRTNDNDLASKYSKNKKLSDLSKRVKMINNSNADIYLSIHLNADNSNKQKGAQVFYSNKNKLNKDYALIFQNNFNKNLYSKRKIKIINNRYLFRNVKKPGILLELGFITNSNDRYLLRNDDYQKKVIKTIKKSLIECFKIN